MSLWFCRQVFFFCGFRIMFSSTRPSFHHSLSYSSSKSTSVHFVLSSDVHLALLPLAKTASQSIAFGSRRRWSQANRSEGSLLTFQVTFDKTKMEQNIFSVVGCSLLICTVLLTVSGKRPLFFTFSDYLTLCQVTQKHYLFLADRFQDCVITNEMNLFITHHVTQRTSQTTKERKKHCSNARIVSLAYP